MLIYIFISKLAYLYAMSKIKTISQELIIKRMRLENPWWDNGSIPEQYAGFKRRPYFDQFFKNLKQTSVKRALVLMGPRRVGKTVMLFQGIAELIKTGTRQRKICYLSIDAPIYNNKPLEELFEMCRTATGDNDPKGFVIIFDEIQYLKNWEVHLKSLVDFYPNTKFIASGSAAAALKLKSIESGAGRFTEFMLPPLTFQEYLFLLDLEYLVKGVVASKNSISKWTFTSPDYDTLNSHFIDYINFGGYPEAISSDTIKQDPGTFIRSDIIDKVLLRDLPGLYGITNVQELYSLFNVIAYNTGNEFNLETLSQNSGVNKVTIKKYLEYLEAAFLIKIIYPVGINTKRFVRESRFKIYLTTPSIRCALFAPILPTDDHFGQMVETAIVAQYLHAQAFPLHFAAWHGGEVDLVAVDKLQKPEWVLEIKWSNQYYQNPGKLKSLIKYCHENGLENATVTSIDKQDVKVYQGINLTYNPAACLCYGLSGKK